MLARPQVASETATEPDRVPRRTRAFVAIFLTVFIVCGLFGFEPWPFTGWKLFSALRTDRTAGWSAVTVDASGEEAGIPFGELPRGYHWATHILNEFPRLDQTRQEQVCAAWAAAVRARGAEVVALRIYRVERFTSHREGDLRAPETSRELRYTCGNGAVQVAP